MRTGRQIRAKQAEKGIALLISIFILLLISVVAIALIVSSGTETALAGTLGRLFALAEAYPDLKANTTMLSLMEELTSTENKVAFARQAYNDAVMTYNTGRETFPTNLIAGPFNFGPAELFVIEKAEEKEAPKVTL